MIVKEAIAFLSKVPPFQFLDEASLGSLANSLSMEFYPRETVILKQDAPSSESLRVIKKGAVKVSSTDPESGEEAVIDYRGEGENFGFLSLLGHEKQRTTIVAIEDTICYLIPRKSVIAFLDSNPAFTEYLLQTHFNKYIHRTFSEMQNKRLLQGSGDLMMFTTQIGELASHPVVTTDGGTSIREVAVTMNREKISSIVITDGDGVLSGIVTDKDLRERVVAQGRDLLDPVNSIMSPALIRVDARENCYDALLKMTQYNIHHLPVIKDGELFGLITNHDLMMLQGRSPLSFVKDIDNQISIEGLSTVSGKVNRLVALLLKEGARSKNITGIVTELNDRLVRRVLELADQHFGPPPVPFAWVAFGSEGRREQVFKTDQDNAIIYADPTDPRQAEDARAYFGAYAARVNDWLVQCGYPPCPAGQMARNPQWCQPLSHWRKYFIDLIATPAVEALVNSLVFLDFRYIHGEQPLADDLRHFIATRAQGEDLFLGSMANAILHNRPPIGFLKSFVVEKSGEHKDQLNLKIKGITPLVDLVRLFSLERGVRDTSTFDRLAALAERNTLVGEYSDDLEHTFDFMTLLRVHHQYEQLDAGLPTDNFINPNQLSNLEKRTIKDAFNLISTIQDAVAERYKSMIW
jgi:CBS domain-containing protein